MKRCGADARKKSSEELRQIVKDLSSSHSISAICRTIGINRSRIYYRPVIKTSETKLEQQIQDVFKANRSVYGARKIKHTLAKKGIIVSRRKVRRIMQKCHLVSVYTKARYKHCHNGCNENNIPNLLERQFTRKQQLDVVVSDLTYVKVGQDWAYVCLVVDLWNREIIGWSVGRNKDAKLVKKAIHSIPYRLDKVNVFHSDRGKEFDNELIEEAMVAFGIKRSLSQKGCPYDNAVIESTNKALKAEFVYCHKFTTLVELECLLFDYVYWYNHKRIHGSLNYNTPISLRKHSN